MQNFRPDIIFALAKFIPITGKKNFFKTPRNLKYYSTSCFLISKTTLTSTSNITAKTKLLLSSSALSCIHRYNSWQLIKNCIQYKYDASTTKLLSSQLPFLETKLFNKIYDKKWSDCNGRQLWNDINNQEIPRNDAFETNITRCAYLMLVNVFV